MVIVPVNDRVIIEPDKREEIKKGGIIIPEGAREAPQTGKVIAVGPGRILFNGEVKPLMVKVGDRVIYSRYGGVEVKLNEKDDSMVLVLQEDDILAIIGADK